MALLSHIEKGVLVVRSVGDHSLEDGFAQLNAGIELAAEYQAETGIATHMLIDTTESQESKDTGDLEQVIAYLAGKRPPLSGRIAVAAPVDVLYGMSRVFSARALEHGIKAQVFRSAEQAWSWLI